MKINYADLPALLEDLNLENAFAGLYGRSSKHYVEEYKVDDELVQGILNDLQVSTTGLTVNKQGISLDSAIKHDVDTDIDTDI